MFQKYDGFLEKIHVLSVSFLGISSCFWFICLVFKMCFKSCVRYSSLFLKDKCISSLIRTKYIEKKFNLQLFFFPLFHEHLFSPGLPRATRLLETSWLEKITVCVIETMLVALPFVQVKHEETWTEQTKYKPR